MSDAKEKAECLGRGEPHDPVLRSFIKFNEATEWQRVLLTIHKRLSDLNENRRLN